MNSSVVFIDEKSFHIYSQKRHANWSLHGDKVTLKESCLQYSQTCVKQPDKEMREIGCLRQVATYIEISIGLEKLDQAT